MGNIDGRNSADGSVGASATFRRTIGCFAGSYAVSSLGFLACQALAGHILGLTEYGPFAALTTGSVVLGQLGTFGLHRSGLRVTARTKSATSDELEAQYAAARAVALLALPLLALVWGAVSLPLLSIHTVPLLMRLAVVACVAAQVHTLAFTTIAAGLLRGSGRVELASVLDGRSGGAAMVAVQSSFLFFLIGDHSPQRLEHCLIAMGLGAIPSGAMAWWWLFAPTRQPTRLGPPATAIVAAIKEGRVFAGIQAVGMLNAQIETWIAAALLVSADASGFASAQRVALLIVLPLTAAQTIFSPTLSRLAAEGRVREIGQLLRATNTLTAVLCLGGSVLLGFFSSLVLSEVFGSGFAASSALLIVLLIGPLGLAAFGMCGVAMSMAGYESSVWSIQGGAVVVRITSGVVCAAVWGGKGLAWSASVVTVLSWVSVALLCKHRMSVSRLFTTSPKDFSAIVRIQG